MSRTALIAVLLVAVVLSAAAYFLLRPEPAAAAGNGRILAFELGKVTEILIGRGGTASERLVRTSDASEWALVMPGTATAWPVMTPQVRGLLRVLSELRGDPATEKPGTDGVTVTLKRENGSDIEFVVGDARLSGRVVLGVLDAGSEAGTYWVDGQVAAALAREGVLMWRDPTLLRGIGPETSKVMLRGAAGEVTAQRVMGRWALTAPLAAAASQEAIEKLVSTLAGLRAAEFVSEVPADQFANPTAEATVTLTTRDETGAAVDATRTLLVGAAADMSGTRLYVRVREASPEGVREYTATVEAKSLASLTTNPVAYIDRRGAVFPAADVGTLVLGEREFKRTTRGWSAVGSAADGDPLLPADTAVVSALAEVVTEHAADGVLLTAPEGATDWHALELRSLGGDPLAMMQAAIRPAGADGKEHAVIRNGDVWRVYAAPGDVEVVRTGFGLAAR